MGHREKMTEHRMSNVLLVEDHEDSGNILRRVLSRDYTVRWVKTEADALQELLSHQYDCLVSDIGLGQDGCGLSLLRRARESNVHIPAIALSGYGMAKDVEECMSVGFACHVLKPVDSSKLLDVLNRVTRRSDGVSEQRKPAAASLGEPAEVAGATGQGSGESEYQRSEQAGKDVQLA